MNTNKLKSYAPKARLAFMEAVTKRAAFLGLYADRIAEITMDGDSAVIEGRVFTRKQGQQRSQLVQRIEALGTTNGKLVLKDGFNQFISETAFTWFNRLTAIRYMEVNEYLDHGFRVLSNGENAKFGEGFEILGSAADVADDLGLNKESIIDMVLDGNKEEELYRTILLGQCHQLSEAMSFMFEKLDDATELLLPDNLTKTDSILKDLINDIPEDNWIDRETGKGQIEVIGWLYQFYISEHKDAVIGKVVKREDIPAATQLFTPNWIVKYLVQNSLGRQWLATYPDSELKEKMAYYITPAEQSDDVIGQLKAITPTNIDPEEIKVLDPACGSGHILVEVYEVLREIYLERGYRQREIPELILTKNIYGLDIDDRAAQMAAFAVLMKAREDDKRIFSRDIKLNIHSIQSTENLNINQLWADLNLEGRLQSGDITDLFGEVNNADNIEMDAVNAGYFALLKLLQSSFINAKNLGSLIDLKQELSKMLGALNLNRLNLNGEFTDKQKLKNKLVALNDPESLGKAYDLVEELALLPSKIQQASDDIALFKTLETGLLDKLTDFKTVLVDILSQSDSITISASNQLLPIVEQAILLANKYDIAVANPPYMGSKGMNAALKDFAKKSFPNSKSDLFAIFMERVFNFLKEDGYNAQVNMQSWMFLSSFEKMRESLLDTKTFITMAHLGSRAFGQISGEVVQTTAWVLNKKHIDGFKPSFLRLIDGKEADKKQALLTKQNLFTTTKQDDFKKIPGSPIAYWFPSHIFDLVKNSTFISSCSKVCTGMTTADNDRFLRTWNEIDYSKFNNSCENKEQAITSNTKWFPYNKGGGNLKWYGLNEYVVNWENNGLEIKSNKDSKGKSRASVRSEEYYFKPSITYSAVSGSDFSSRISLKGSLFDSGGSSIFSEYKLEVVQAVLSSSLTPYFLKAYNSTINIQPGDIARIPIPHFSVDTETQLISYVRECVSYAKTAWDINEISWDFDRNLLIKHSSTKIKNSTNLSFKFHRTIMDNLKNIEHQINNTVLTSFDFLELLVDTDTINQACTEIKPCITSIKFKTESIIDLCSYSLGCIMGRYSLDREGLVYAHSGNNGFKKLVAEDAYKTFPADDDGIVPLADEEWLFDDDATTRFREFVKTVWGDSLLENGRSALQENLDFVAESLSLNAIKPKKGESSMDTIRRYFSTQFYKDHLKTYKKRPIYWLFSSGKEKAFECLVYLHRYNESTLSRMRTEYVTPLMGKLESRKNILEDSKATATGAEQRAIDKELKTIDKKQAELIKFDEELKHLAEMKISIELDDGVKVNYGKFGNLLSDVKAIHGKAPEKIK